MTIDGPAHGRPADQMQVTVHIPDGFTNTLDLDSFDPNAAQRFIGLGSSWRYAVTNMAMRGTNRLVWSDVGQMGRVSVAGVTSRYYRQNDPLKQAVAWYVKSRTVVGDSWSCQELDIGSRTNVSMKDKV